MGHDDLKGRLATVYRPDGIDRSERSCGVAARRFGEGFVY
jgi:hypothetical protein